MSRAMRAVAIAAVVLLSAPGQTIAQEATPERACTYESCALRLWDSDVLEGQSAEQVARFGFFSPPAVRELFQSSDSAAHYLRVVEDNYTTGRVIWFIGQVASWAGVAMYFSSDAQVQQGGFIAQTAGFAVSWLGNRRVTRAEEAMSRAVWWYNRDISARHVARKR